MYEEARRFAFSQSLGRLEEASGAAVTTTLKIMLDTNAPPGIRLRAAEIVLQQSAKASELDKLGARLAKRERKEREKTSPGNVTLVNATPLLGPSVAQPVQSVYGTDSNEGSVTP
jgi:hypothetical protein